MAIEIPAVRIFPMSDKADGFVGRSIADVQAKLFLRDLPRSNGRWRYPRQGLNSEPGTVVLFQFKARVIALATFLRDEPADDGGGRLSFDPQSFRAFDPIDAAGLRAAWPSFRAFGQVKQRLNPMRFPTFRRRLKHVRRP